MIAHQFANKGIASAKSRTSIGALAILILSSSTALSAAPPVGEWSGAAGTDWTDSNNWVDGEIPGPTDTATINSSNPAVLSGQAVTIHDLVMSNGPTTANLTVSEGGVLTINRYLMASTEEDGNSSLTITGQGSRVVAGLGLQVGNGDNSTSAITINQGGTLETVGGGLYLVKGATLDVSGTGSKLLVGTAHSGVPATWSDADGWFSISDATVTVSGGATVETDGVHVQGSASGDAAMTLSGSNTRMSAGMVIYVGGNGSAPTGAGSLTIEDGAQASAARIFLGIASTDSGRLLLTGAGSTLSSIPDGHGALGNFGVGFEGSGVAVIQNGAKLSVANELRIAQEAGSTGTLVIGAEEGHAAADVGTIEAGAGVVFGAGTGELIFNHTSSNYVFASNITGNGTIKAVAGTTNLTGDSSGFTGAISVTGGILNVAGAIGAVSTVESGAKLTGSGTVGGVVALTGSTVAPGNSPGTLTVTGNYSQAAGSSYAAELVRGSSVSDFINVSGTATIASGATLDVSGYGNGSYVVGTRYTVLSAAGGLTGTYTINGTDISAFYSIDPTYDANNLYLDVIQSRAFASAALTPNQIATATALDTLSSTNSVSSAVGTSATDEIARSAFDRLSGEIYASAKTALLDDSRFVRDTTTRQVRASAGAQEPSIWMQGYGSWGNFDGNGNAGGFDRNAGGFFVGADGDVFDAMRLGVVAGYGHSSLSLDGGRGSMGIDTYSLGLYGGGEWNKLNVSFGVNQAWHQLSADRSINIAGLSNALSADYDARTTQVYGDLGYRIDLGSVSFEPFAGIAYVNQHTDRFAETGGDAALSGSAGNTDAKFTTIGLRSGGSFDLDGNTIKANGMIGWRHAIDEVVPTTTNSFAGSSAFTVSGTPLARDVAVIEAGISADIAPNASLGLTYTGQFGSGVSDQGVKANFNLRF